MCCWGQRHGSDIRRVLLDSHSLRGSKFCNVKKVCWMCSVDTRLQKGISDDCYRCLSDIIKDFLSYSGYIYDRAK